MVLLTTYQRNGCALTKDFNDDPDDEEDLRSSQECMDDLAEEFRDRALLANSKRFFIKNPPRFSASKTQETQVKNKRLVAESYDLDEEEVSLYDEEMVEHKVLMALADDEKVYVGKEDTING
ncbi:hypothetical protein Tco_1044188 [Tanacetum coccineum]|uniref:Uncharacterized protein n=1 Tax=Tanacetum coccineum TaxID=301880 RepID=A0ABQ5GPM5_9ASTR